MAKKISDYGVPEFEDLQTSTRTVMVYTNMEFNMDAIFHGLTITEVEVPLTKKKKNVDKKKLRGPYGSIISVIDGCKNRFRGVYIRKLRKYWCPMCSRIKLRGDREVKDNTVVEVFEKDEKPESDVRHIKYQCTVCSAYLHIRQLGKIPNFLNELTIPIFLDGIMLNIMLFKNNMKIAGCKENSQAKEAIMVLWEEYISKIPNSYTMKFPRSIKPSFVFYLVMRNVDFKLGFFIDRRALNKLMNNPKYKNMVFMSQHQSTAQTNVNIKMYSGRPNNFRYECLEYDMKKKSPEPVLKLMKENPYRPNKKDPANERITAIVFSSSEIILTGRYEEKMKDAYEFFVRTTMENRDLLEEKLFKPSKDFQTYIRELNQKKIEG